MQNPALFGAAWIPAARKARNLLFFHTHPPVSFSSLIGVVETQTHTSLAWNAWVESQAESVDADGNLPVPRIGNLLRWLGKMSPLLMLVNALLFPEIIFPLWRKMLV